MLPEGFGDRDLQSHGCVARATLLGNGVKMTTSPMAYARDGRGCDAEFFGRADHDRDGVMEQVAAVLYGLCAGFALFAKVCGTNRGGTIRQWE